MVVDDVIDRVVSNLYCIVRLLYIWRAVSWCSNEWVGEHLVDSRKCVSDELVSRDGIGQILFDVRRRSVKFVNERRSDVKRVLFSEHRDAP